MFMSAWYRRSVGIINILLILSIDGLVGFLSILSLASDEQARSWHEHPVQFVLGRVVGLMVVALILTGIIAGINIVYNLISGLRIERTWYASVIPVVLWCLLSSFIISLTGSLLLLFA